MDEKFIFSRDLNRLKNMIKIFDDLCFEKVEKY